MDHIDLRLAVTDAPVGDLPVYIRCREPKHNDKNRGNLAVYPDHLHCYGCGLHLELKGAELPRHRDPLAYLLGVTPAQARQVASKYTAKSLDAYRERVTDEAKKQPLPPGLAYAYQQMLLPVGIRGARRAWLLERGLASGVIDQAALGHDGTRFTIPYFAPDPPKLNSRLITIRFRRDDLYGVEEVDGRPIPKYMGMRGRNGLYLYPEHWLSRDTRDWVVVCEGEFDTLRLWQENIPAVTLPNGAGNLPKLIPLLKASYPRIKRLYLAADQDPAGRLASVLTRQAAREAGYRVTRARWPESWGKDITDLHKGGHSLREAYWHGDDKNFPG